jgi:hypothetical protein
MEFLKLIVHVSELGLFQQNYLMILETKLHKMVKNLVQQLVGQEDVVG